MCIRPSFGYCTSTNGNEVSDSPEPIRSFDGDVEKASWVTLTVPTWPSGNDWNYVDSGDISLAGYVGTKVYIAFRYTSTTTTAPTWEIKSLTIK